MNSTTQIAWTAVVDKDGFTLGMAEEGIGGYSPMKPECAVRFTSYNAAQDAADERNALLGLTPLEAMMIVASSMRAQRADKQWGVREKWERRG